MRRARAGPLRARERGGGCGGVRLALHRGRLLEALDGLRGAQRAGGRVGGNLGRAAVVARREQLLELVRDEVLGAGQAGARGERERERQVLELADDVGHDGRLLERDGEDLPLAVDANQPARRRVVGRDEDGLGGDAIHVDHRAALEVVHVAVAELGHHEDHAVLGRDLHGDGEVVCRLGREEDVRRLLGEAGRAGRARAGRDLDHVQLGALRALHREGEQRRLGRGAVSLELRKRGRVALDRLRDVLLDGEELHRADDAVGARLRGGRRERRKRRGAAARVSGRWRGLPSQRAAGRVRPYASARP